MSRRNHLLLLLCLGTISAIFAYHVSKQPMDLRVYHYGARGVFSGTRPVYGIASGLGWPMHYRYPPLFLLLFAPLAMLPLGTAAVVWVVAKIAVLVWIVQVVRKRVLSSAEPSPCRARPSAVAIPSHWYILSFLFITPYLVEEFRYGNAQFFVLGLTIASLLMVRDKPTLAAASLALGIAIKVWPVFFLPYLAARRQWRAVFYSVAFVAVLAIVPSLYFGFGGNQQLLGEWFTQEFQTQLGPHEIWFPNQSLRGVLMRYLTMIDYSQVPDSNYAQVNFVSINPATVRVVWVVLAAAIYAGFLFVSNRRRESDGLIDHGFAFCLVALLEPFTQKYALAILLWPAIAAASLLKDKRIRVLLYGATIFVLIQPLTPGASTQRFLQVLGMDFWATLLLTSAFVKAAAQRRHNISHGRQPVENMSPEKTVP